MKRLRVDQRAGLLMGGVIFASFIALGASVALPAADPELAGEGEERSRLEMQGMRVYRNEGCWYCHTQYLRSSAVDGQYGEALGPEAYAADSPAMLGHERVGPDLTRRERRFADAAGLVAFLRDPAEDAPHTAMPSYAYLGEDDLRALAAYLLSLR
jgi:cbb3-type cytochrome oxidase cytochrome c subunit